MDKKMIQFIQIVIFLSLVTVPFSAISDDRTNENHFERMEFYLEQALWKFEDGNFIVYRTKKGFLDFVLFPEIPMNTFKTNVYKSNQNTEIDSIEVVIDKHSTMYQFNKEKLLVLFIYKNKTICNDYIEFSTEEWGNIAQDFSMIRNNSEQYVTLYNFFKTKSKKCR